MSVSFHATQRFVTLNITVSESLKQPLPALKLLGCVYVCILCVFVFVCLSEIDMSNL